MFSKVKYSELSAKQKEIYNFQKIAALLADYGFNCIKLADDWQGADFLAYHKDDNKTIRVQLKSRITIDKKYCSQNLWMAFPVRGDWYLIKHADLLTLVDQETNWLKSSSWIDNDSYSSYSPSKRLEKRLHDYKL